MSRSLIAVVLVGALTSTSLAQTWNNEGWSRQEVMVYVPTPPPPRTVYRPITGLWVAGLVVFVTSWLTHIGVTAGFDGPRTTTAAIPLAGPWIQFDQPFANDSNKLIGQALLATSGVVQIAGAAMLVLGVSIWRKETRYSKAPRWFASPLVSPTGVGVMAGAGF
jgi:hypothetical protein